MKTSTLTRFLQLPHRKTDSMTKPRHEREDTTEPDQRTKTDSTCHVIVTYHLDLNRSINEADCSVFSVVLCLVAWWPASLACSGFAKNVGTMEINHQGWPVKRWWRLSLCCSVSREKKKKNRKNTTELCARQLLKKSLKTRERNSSSVGIVRGRLTFCDWRVMMSNERKSIFF